MRAMSAGSSRAFGRLTNLHGNANGVDVPMAQPVALLAALSCCASHCTHTPAFVPQKNEVRLCATSERIGQCFAANKPSISTVTPSGDLQTQGVTACRRVRLELLLFAWGGLDAIRYGAASHT
jgi:hypothetical protein